jgi:hypothetical protein
MSFNNGIKDKINKNKKKKKTFCQSYGLKLTILYEKMRKKQKKMSKMKKKICKKTLKFQIPRGSWERRNVSYVR